MICDFSDVSILRNALTVAWHPKLIKLLEWFIAVYGGGWTIVTSTYREGDKGVHGTIPLRAFDLRYRVFTRPEEVSSTVNSVWNYDPKRPKMKVCIYHDIGKGAHLHFQVHDNTVRREE